MSENITLTSQEIDEMILSLLKKHSDDIEIDTENFLDLLKHSLSLNTLEKKRVVDAAETLSQFQFDELTKVFLEERDKFRDLAAEHPEDIKKLLSKQHAEWETLGQLYHNELQASQQEEDDQSKIEDIKANLGL
jgi:hypothetical protein